MCRPFDDLDESKNQARRTSWQAITISWSLYLPMKGCCQSICHVFKNWTSTSRGGIGKVRSKRGEKRGEKRARQTNWWMDDWWMDGWRHGNYFEARLTVNHRSFGLSLSQRHLSSPGNEFVLGKAPAHTTQSTPIVTATTIFLRLVPFGSLTADKQLENWVADDRLRFLLLWVMMVMIITTSVVFGVPIMNRLTRWPAPGVEVVEPHAHTFIHSSHPRSLSLLFS